MTDKIVLNNGQEIEGATIVQALWSNSLAFVSIPGNDLVSAAVLFGNTENVSKITGYSSIYKDTFYGYTFVKTIGVNTGNNTVEIWLSGDENSKHTREYADDVPKSFTPEAITERFHELDKETNQNGPESNDSAGSD